MAQYETRTYYTDKTLVVTETDSVKFNFKLEETITFNIHLSEGRNATYDYKVYAKLADSQYLNANFDVSGIQAQWRMKDIVNTGNTSSFDCTNLDKLFSGEYALLGTYQLTDIERHYAYSALEPYTVMCYLYGETLFDLQTPNWRNKYDSVFFNWENEDSEYCEFHMYRMDNVVAENGNIGDTVTITVTNDSDECYHSVFYSYSKGNLFGENWKQVGDKEFSKDTQYTFTIPQDFYAQIPNDRQGEIYIISYSCHLNEEDGTVEYHNVNSARLIAYVVEEDCVPEITPYVYDTNSHTVILTGNKDKLIRFASYPTITVNDVFKPKNYATISYFSMMCNGAEAVAKNDTEYYIENFTGDYITFEMIDSRGFSKIVTYTPDVIAYIKKTCNINADTPTADNYFNFTISGNYWTGNFGAYNNTLSVHYAVKIINRETGVGEWGAWQTASHEITGGTYMATVSIGGIDYRDTFCVKAYATDRVGDVYAKEITISAIPVFDWGINDFNMNCDMAVYGTLTVNGNIVATGNVNGQGSGVSAYEIHYGTCQTSQNEDAKLVTSPTFTTLSTGSSIRVKFTNTNTVSLISMNVNGTGAKQVIIDNTNNDLYGKWKSGSVRDFVYDGTNWCLVSYA